MEYTMQNLRPGQCGTVTAVNLEPEMKKRLREFGLTENTVVECVGKSPLGDPAAYRIRGVTVALRNRDTAQICLRR